MDRRRRFADVKEIDGDIRTGQKLAETLNDVDRSVCRWREVNRNQCAAQLHIAAHLIDETAGTRRNEQRRYRGAAENGLRHRALQPVRDAVPSVSRDHDEIAAILAQKIDDGSRRLLQFEANVVDLDSE